VRSWLLSLPDNEDYRTSLTRSRSFGTRLLWKVLNFVDMASLFITISQVLRNQESRTFFLLLPIAVNYFICPYFHPCKFWSRGFWNSFLFHFQTWYMYTVKFDMMDDSWKEGCLVTTIFYTKSWEWLHWIGVRNLSTLLD